MVQDKKKTKAQLISELVELRQRLASLEELEGAPVGEVQGGKGTLQLYKDIVEGIPIGVAILKLEDPGDLGSFRYVDFNPIASEIAGMAVKEQIGTQMRESRPALLETDIPRLYAEAIRTGDMQELPEIRYGDEQLPEAVWSVLALPLGGEYVAVLFDNITECKQAEQKIQASLQEKEVLLKEINHRVKNNLQLVSSLLRHQSTTIKDEQVLQVFRESQDRVRSIALIHEKLYQSTDLARIDFADYLRSLTSSLFLSYGASSEAIELKIHAEGVHLGVDTAIPCALIINELVSNSLQHAFPDGREGEIRIEIRSEEDQSLLMVSDNGVGFPEDLDLRTTETTGLELVRTLVDQLGGTIEGTSAGGAGTLVPGTGASSAPAGTSGTAFNITFANSKVPNEIK